MSSRVELRPTKQWSRRGETQARFDMSCPRGSLLALYEQGMKVELDEWCRSVQVESGGSVILDVADFPVVALKTQLRAWLDMVDDASSLPFVFSSENPELHGVFRIEPRPERWQFTSWKERMRCSELLSLEEWRNVLRQSGV